MNNPARREWIRKVVNLHFPMSDWEAMYQFAKDAMAVADANNPRIAELEQLLSVRFQDGKRLGQLEAEMRADAHRQEDGVCPDPWCGEIYPSCKPADQQGVRECLEFYANPANYDYDGVSPSPIELDCGAKARASLEGGKP